MRLLLKRLRRAVREWWECRTKRCAYYDHYLAYGPAELTHEGYHAAERRALRHMLSCRAWERGECSTCLRWEERLRA